MRLISVFFVLVLALNGCGGGGGSTNENNGDDTNTNNAPTAQSDNITLNEDSDITIILKGNDADSDNLSYRVVTQPANGSLSGTAPNVSYRPSSEYNGGDSFSFVVNDGTEDSVEAQVTLTIISINDIPTANDQSVSLDQDSSLVINLSGTDIETQNLTFSVETLPDNGVLTGTAPALTYTPNSGYSGTDTFTFVSNDGELSSALATVDLSIKEDSGISPPAIQRVPLNDTGMIYGGNYPNSNNSNCTGETIAQQDCSHGRDATHPDSSDGFSGFSFTKVDANGSEVLANATQWSCVKDNVTGLIWEVKTTDGGLHDASWTYSWLNTTGINNGNYTGTSSFGECGDSVAAGCDTEKFVAQVNAVGYCGANNWRLPSMTELANLVNYNHSISSLDPAYFPNENLTIGLYWSATPYAQIRGQIWRVGFSGHFSGQVTGSRYSVRLVHDTI